MSRVDRYPLPSQQEFELPAERCTVVHGAVRGAAMGVAIVAAPVQPPCGAHHEGGASAGQRRLHPRRVTAMPLRSIHHPRRTA